MAHAKAPPNLHDLRERHQAVVGAMATLHIRFHARYDPPNHGLGEEEVEYWRDGTDFRLVYKTSNGRRFDYQGISGTLKAFIHGPPVTADVLPSKSGTIGPMRRTLYPDPGMFCLFKVPGKTSMDWLPLAESLDETHGLKSLRTVNEKGKEYFVITLDYNHGKFEAWLSENHNYLIERLIIWPNEGGTNPVADYVVDEFKEISPGIPFPTKISTRFYSPSDGKLCEVKTVIVDEINMNRPISKSQLEFLFPPGEIVLDLVNNKVWRTNDEGEIGTEAKDEKGQALTIVKGSMHPALENGATRATSEESEPLISRLLPLSLSLIAAGLFLMLFKKYRLKM